MVKINKTIIFVFLLIFVDQIYGKSTQNRGNIENENDLIYEAIKKYEDDALENNKLSICSYAISKFLNDKQDGIKFKLENETKESRGDILSKLYYSTIEKCLNKLREEYLDTYITIGFIEEIKWDEFLNIDLSNLKIYQQQLTEGEVIIQKSIEKIIDGPILERETLINIFGFRLKYENLPYVAVIFAFLLVAYAIPFKEFIFNPDPKIRQNAYGINNYKKNK